MMSGLTVFNQYQYNPLTPDAAFLSAMRTLTYVSSSQARLTTEGTELRRNLAESGQRKKATAYAVALFRTFRRRNHIFNPFWLATSRSIPRLPNS
ncbi:hypothetical protein A6J33_006765 [Pantoea sp. FDAARGOS_194]|jgi:hypothetical protein|nr:hypothetical protein A6J33_006765 [Pantoea sp. FDAARGOS_194]HAB24835.1 hypothetical protein [Pantoea sp.]HAB74584.1 hypothetical protein [Pantoea sp.]